MTPAGWLFWIASALLVWVYAGYPVAAAIKARVRPFVPKSDSSARPLVTVGIAAHDEGRQLEGRVANILAQEGPFELEVIVASDGSTDQSMAILERLASSEKRIRYLDLARGGQTAAQNAIFREAQGEIVILSDAETRFAPGCIAQLVAPFADQRVGCTTGRLEWVDAKRTQTSRNEGLYWRYEQLVRRLESRAGWLTAVTGALLAVRHSSYRDVPAHASMDHLLPLYVRAEGRRVVAVPEAVAADRPIAGLRAQFQNRSRTATRGIRANLSMAARLAPWRDPSAALAIWSHKLLRWGTPWLVGLAALGAGIELLAGGSGLWAIPLAAIAAWVVLSVAAWAIRRRRATPPRVAAFALAVAVVNAAFLVGWWNLMRGQRIEAWHRSRWTTENAGSRARGR
ncbi:MAG: glycosyltransferase [Chloroflexi bacterium]|nr:glycosyltransferase [Chloroflexota bacterium]